jgi:hypothetical protein
MKPIKSSKRLDTRVSYSIIVKIQIKACTWPSKTPPDTRRRQAGRARQMGRGAVSAPGQCAHLGDAVRISDDPNAAR